jgi:hypothetical protein
MPIDALRLGSALGASHNSSLQIAYDYCEIKREGMSTKAFFVPEEPLQATFGDALIELKGDSLAVTRKCEGSQLTPRQGSHYAFALVEDAGRSVAG